jgi:3-hydroxyacyl-CoA dehydrogenase
MPPVAKVFETISTAHGLEVRRRGQGAGLPAPQDGVTMNRDRLLYDAKQKALALVEGYAARAGRAPPARPLGKASLMLAVEGFAQGDRDRLRHGRRGRNSPRC